MSDGVIVCSVGCCPGCQNCYGYSIGCHQGPCRCAEPCLCDYAHEEDDPGWRHGCTRHNGATDTRFLGESEPDWSPADDAVERVGSPLPRVR